ncbi:nuclear transport factor 2 family protein [Conexibacter arvalis]|uniref:Glyoxylase-like metal-dependent hydrolase (Beta-lactamase superfamily II)/predicted ester cyclase n=1 Tax=Conexibacter arvalis TaxID=912552 RepID=A0A840IFV8_9ACTN|nr:nuclear transport factor 2 family protein [Conexibacter arvalis]MBB4663225.1 glyoxylase-like metal-dependent hydrolase (beta-lactamase superfamily II)/predicted ester cyclase [Conexibacter arvalis]
MGSARRAEAAAATEAVARRYFAAVAARDPEAMAACWQPGGIDRLHGQADLVAPDGVRAYFGELFAAFPDLAVEILSTTADAERCAVRWRMTATFAGPGRFQRFEPNGARVSFEAVDVVRVEDGLIAGNDAYLDGMDVARQLGVLPPRDSGQERGLAALVNGRTRVARMLAANAPERIADGVWLVRGGLPRKVMNVYLLEHDGGVVMFDAGVKAMTDALAATGARMGGIRRIVLGHSHADHRGAAAGLDAEVFCHPLERADAEGDGGAHYLDKRKLDAHGRVLLGRLLPIWDGGPLEVAGTVEEGDEVAGFEVVHLPGHAPGLIGLWRASDRLALVSDCFYTLDPQTGVPGALRVPHEAFNHSTDDARASMRKLAALRPATAWCGHGEPLTGDVADQLERAAAQ